MKAINYKFVWEIIFGKAKIELYSLKPNFIVEFLSMYKGTSLS